MSQTDAVLRYMQKGRSISPLQALDQFGCFRLAARIREIRDRGHKVKATTVKVGQKRYARYNLEILAS